MMDNYSDISSIDTSTGTETSRSTHPGLGYLSGKAIKRLGEAVLNGVDYIVVNRQLSRIEANFRKDGSLDKHEAEGRGMYSILLELTHPGYPFPVQTRALRIMMEQIGSMKFKSLAAALVGMNSTFITHRHLSTIIGCLWSSRGIGVSSDTATIRDTLTTKKIAACQAAGYEAYMAAFATNSHDMSVLFSSSAFILYLAFIATIGSKDHARIIFNLVISRFLELIGLFNPLNSRNETIAGRLLMHIIALRLDPIQDSDTVAIINNSISTLKLSITSGSKLGASTNDDMEDVWTRLETSYIAELSQQSPLTDVVSDAIEFIREDLLFRNVQRNVDSSLVESVKVLLLGSGECGKTTIMKQLLLSHRGSERFTSQFSDEITYRSDLVNDVVSFLKGLVKVDSDISEELDRVTGLNALVSFIQKTSSLVLLQSLADENISYRLRVLKRIGELPLFERGSYEPTEEDLLRWYIKTTGLYEETFETTTRNYHVWDCGGQISERKKWIHCFQDASVLLYVASLAGYDQVLIEDGVSNRLQDSLTIFDSLCHSSWLKQTRIILVLTKRDCLSKPKLLKSPLEHHFPDYTGGADENAAFEYIKKRFISLAKHRGRLPVHVINPNNAEEVKALFERIGEELDSARN